VTLSSGDVATKLTGLTAAIHTLSAAYERRCKILRRHSEREHHHHSAINERPWVDG
jgi:hypothetical protein